MTSSRSFSNVLGLWHTCHMIHYVITSCASFIFKKLKGRKVYKRKKKKKIKSKKILNQEKYIKEKKNVSVQVHHDTGAVDISSVSDVAGSIILFSSKAYFSVILNDPSTSDSTSMLSWLCLAILPAHGIYHNDPVSVLYTVCSISYHNLYCCFF